MTCQIMWEGRVLSQPAYNYNCSTDDFLPFRQNRYFVPTIVSENWYTYILYTGCDSFMIHAEGSRSASLCREATR